MIMCTLLEDFRLIFSSERIDETLTWSGTPTTREALQQQGKKGRVYKVNQYIKVFVHPFYLLGH